MKMDITEGVDKNIASAIEKSIEKNNVETVKLLISFTREVISLSVHNNSIQNFNKYIYFFPHIYLYTFSKLKFNLNLTEFAKNIGLNTAMHLKEIIMFNIGFKRRQNKQINELELLNPFYYNAFNSFSRLLYHTVNNIDIVQFSYVMDEFDQIDDDTFSQFYGLQSSIREFERENVDGRHDVVLKAKKSEYKAIRAFYDYRRHVIEGIKFWVIFRYSEDSLNEDIVLKFLERLNTRYFPEDLIQDINLFNSIEGTYYMDWLAWDYIDRPSGKSYSKSGHHEWLTLGIIADQIRSNHYYLNIEDSLTNELQKSSIPLFLIRDYCNQFTRHYDKWKDILNVNTKEELEQKCQGVLRIFEEINRTRTVSEDREIVDAELSSVLVDDFKNSVGTSWESQAFVHRMFKSIGTTENLTGNHDTELKRIGARQFFEKAKMMFIEGDHHRPIYGIGQMGGQVGRWEDDEFFRAIAQAEIGKVTGSNLIQTLENCISTLDKRKMAPDLILISSEHSYLHQTFQKDERFIPKMNLETDEDDLKIFLIGTFSSIPVYYSFSDYLNNKVIVCNFKESCKMRYKTNPDWFKEELNVAVRNVTHEEAQRKFQKNPDKWTKVEGGNLTETQALIVLMTSVMIDIWVIADFQIVNTEAIVLGIINSSKASQ